MLVLFNIGRFTLPSSKFNPHQYFMHIQCYMSFYHCVMANIPELLSCQHRRLLLIVVMLGNLSYSVLQFQIAGRDKLIHQQTGGMCGELIMNAISTIADCSIITFNKAYVHKHKPKV